MRRTEFPCGSELAREGGATVNEDIECTGLFASKLAPTVGRWRASSLWPLKIPCGSGLAREGGITVNEDVECTGLFASKLAPTVGRWRASSLWPLKIPCGSGLAREGGMTVNEDADQEPAIIKESGRIPTPYPSTQPPAKTPAPSQTHRNRPQTACATPAG